MRQKFKIKVTVAIDSKTPNSSQYVIEKDYEGEGTSPGTCRTNAEGQAMRDWEQSFGIQWKAERSAAGKSTALTVTCLEFNITKRY